MEAINNDNNNQSDIVNGNAFMESEENNKTGCNSSFKHKRNNNIVHETGSPGVSVMPFYKVSNWYPDR